MTISEFGFNRFPQTDSVPNLAGLMIDSGTFCQFKFELMATVSGLQDDPKRIGRGARTVPRRDCFRSGELKLPADRSIRRRRWLSHVGLCAARLVARPRHVAASIRRRRQLATVGEFVDAERDTVGIIVVWPVIHRSQRQDGAWTNHERQAEEVMPLAMPAGAFLRLAGQQVRPTAGRQVVVNRAVLGEDGSDEERVSEHVLAVQRVTRRIVWKFEHHGAHHGHAFAMGFEGCAPEIRHETALQFREQAEHVARFLVVRPGNR